MATETVNKPRIYTLHDFNTIVNEVQFEISQSTIDMINLLANKVGAPSYNKTPNFKNREYNRNSGRGNGDRRRRKKQNVEISDADWEAIRSFQATELEQKEGIDKLIDNIKGEINKLTDKTFDVQSEKIHNILNELVSNEAFKTDDENKVGAVIFDIASSNKFYSKIYAKLFAGINDEFEFMNGVFDLTSKSYMTKLTNIETVDPNEDYEKFCEINKDNENRKALSSFFVNLMKEDVIPAQVVVNIANSLLDKLDISLDDPTSDITDQLSENIAIIVTESWKMINDEDLDLEDECESIQERIKHITTLKSKHHSGLSNKTIFQFMDINENIN